MRNEHGSSAAATLILVGGVISVTSLLLFFGTAFLTLERAQSVTDQAALEAADAASGRIPGYPCNRAERLASKNKFSVEKCEVQGLIARVTLQVTVLGFVTQTRAKAGPKNELP
ncbi:Rv3654c family TadE-like protein [uncultured Aurantimicrobium sp.]|uniref:Rv3654c family TadE-like protein n=1 Tax=uncultured Aurantimicrobium sp. TaxID=1705357 RepID=UPI00261D1DDA|nr:Rv3654c family TadE-like protein [uncultured Aurantimicrobium sp.]